MARFRLELGPIPLHHQVYLDLKAALDARRVAPRRPPADRARPRRALRLQPHHGPPRARASWSASSGSSGPAGAARSCSTRASTATSPGELSFTEEMQIRGLDPETRLVAARPESAGEAVAARARARARLADALPRAAAPRRRRAAAARAGPPAGRAVPRPARLGPRARIALRPADRALRRSGRPAREVLEPVLLRAREARLLGRKPGTPALLIEGIASTADGTPVEFGRTFVRGDRTRYYVERVVVPAALGWTRGPRRRRRNAPMASLRSTGHPVVARRRNTHATH